MWSLLKTRTPVLVLLLCIILLVSACGSPPPSPSVSGTAICIASPGQQTVCQIVLTNKATSRIAFNWSASSEPGGVHFSQFTGTVKPGKQSSKITFTIPAQIACPVKIDFADRLTGAKVEYAAQKTQKGKCM